MSALTPYFVPHVNVPQHPEQRRAVRLHAGLTRRTGSLYGACALAATDSPFRRVARYRIPVSARPFLKIDGSEDDDVINGCSGDDFISDSGGDNRIFAGGGDDRVLGGTGEDVVFAGSHVAGDLCFQRLAERRGCEFSRTAL